MNQLDGLAIKYLSQRLIALEAIVESLGVIVVNQLPAIAPGLKDLADDWKEVAEKIESEYQVAVDKAAAAATAAEGTAGG